MKILRNIVLISVLQFGLLPMSGQSTQKSSGVIELKMTKKQPEQVPEQRNVSSTTFKPVMQKPQASGNSQASTSVDAKSEIKWFAPAVYSVNTSRNSFAIKATISSEENLSVVNIFVNDKFFKNLIVNSNSGNRMTIDETVDLVLGNNVIRIEGIGVSGKKVEDKVFINYDLSSARYYALIIAVEDYNDPSINDLSEPINDADKFFNIISSRYTFNQEDITYLRNPTKAEIIGTLHKMRGYITEEDNLLIYYAGHGFWDEEMMTGYWLPSDAESDNPVNWLPNTDLTNYLNALKTKHTLLVADACFSGGIFKTRSAFNVSGSIEKLYKLPSRKAITSGTLKEVPDKSVFIEYLLKELKENNDNYRSSEQLFSNIRTKVMNNSDNVPQYGTIQNVGDEGGDFIFIRRQ